MDADDTLKKPIVSGIDSNKMEALILDLYNYLETINSKMDSVEQQFDSLSASCKGICFSSFMNEVTEFEKNFAIIKSNIQSYINDLTNAKNNFQKVFSNSFLISRAMESKEEEKL